MIIKNIQTGKEVRQTRKEWDSMKKYQHLFQVISDTDEEEAAIENGGAAAIEQVITNTTQKSDLTPITSNKSGKDSHTTNKTRKRN